MASWAAFETTRPSALEEAACSDSHCCDGDAFVAVVISFLILDSIRFYLLLISCYICYI